MLQSIINFFKNLYAQLFGIPQSTPLIPSTPAPIVVPAPEIPVTPAAPVTPHPITPKAPVSTPVASKYVIPSYDVKGARHLKKALETLIDTKLSTDYATEFRAACDAKDGNKLVSLANMALVGTREVTHDDGPTIELIQSTIGSPQHQAWCMDQQQSCIAYAERKTGVASKIAASESVTETWRSTTVSCRVDRANLQAGDLWLWEHGTTWEGHTGNFQSLISLNMAELVEGNTSSGANAKGEIERDGGGTYVTRRPFAPVGNMHLLGFLRAF